ncbi:hypothetical protein FHX44_115071 [Pseudonocardia hierapolitana]|uniref:Uncharacterized protein n=1 Tax=Pseudonocardia hierapolitana TaxID=1128676 RepID=A0A561SWA5_9PSEU|nr:hypothetical protein FHX44_115071 [Pseudonocardia hierapolitana]
MSERASESLWGMEGSTEEARGGYELSQRPREAPAERSEAVR